MTELLVYCGLGKKSSAKRARKQAVQNRSLPQIDQNKFTPKEIVVLIISTALALATVKSDDPWILVPMLLVSWGGFVYICITHPGTRTLRTLVGLGLTAIIFGIGGRVLWPKSATASQEQATTKPTSEHAAMPPVDQAKQDFDDYTHQLINDEFDFQEELRLVPRESLFHRDPVARWRALYPQAEKLRKRFAAIPGGPIRSEVVDRLTATVETIKKPDEIMEVRAAFVGMEVKLRHLTSTPSPGFVISHSDHSDAAENTVENATMVVTESNHTKLHRNKVSVTTTAQ